MCASGFLHPTRSWTALAELCGSPKSARMASTGPPQIFRQRASAVPVIRRLWRLFTQSWRGPEPLLRIVRALMLFHSPKEILEAMWAHRLLR
jgi:hypothetical protein